MKYLLKGEDFLAALGLELAEAHEFHGVVVYRFWGTQAQMITATDMLAEAYPNDEKATFGDAKWLGHVRATLTSIPDKKLVYDDLYELIVMRKV